MTREDRGTRMGLRLRRAADEAGLPGEAGALLLAVHGVAMERRRAALAEDHFLFLHPGRTALILLGDAGARDPDLLTASVVLDTAPSPLEPADETVTRVGGGRALEVRNAVPRPDHPDLTEALVVAEEEIRVLALAERLDHLRHLHLESRTGIREEHRLATEVYLPVAERTHPTLARRYRWWCGMFARRWLSRAV